MVTEKISIVDARLLVKVLALNYEVSDKEIKAERKVVDIETQNI